MRSVVEVIITVAPAPPRARALAKPIPAALPAPVTIAILPVRFITKALKVHPKKSYCRTAAHNQWKRVEMSIAKNGATIDRERLRLLHQSEQQRFIDAHPKSKA